MIKWQTQLRIHVAQQARKKKWAKNTYDGRRLMHSGKPGKKNQHLTHGRKNLVFMNSRHFVCRIRTLPNSTQTFASDTLRYSTSRFGPFFSRIVGVLTVVKYVLLTVRSWPHFYHKNWLLPWKLGITCRVNSQKNRVKSWILILKSLLFTVKGYFSP